MTRSSTPASPQASQHLIYYLRVLSKRRYTAIATLLAVVGTVGFVTARAVPQFLARAQVMIEVERPRVVVFETDQQNERNSEPQDYQETQRRILQSRSLARRTLETLGLWQHPTFSPPPEDPPGPVMARVYAVGQWIADLPKKISKSPNYKGGGLEQPEGPDPDEALGFKDDAEHAAAIDRFLARLTVTQAGTSRLVDVSFTADDPKLAAAVVNALTDAYIEQNKELKSGIAQEAADWLEEQLEGHRKQLQESQKALQQFREQRPDASDTTDLGTSRLESLNTSLMNARTDRIQKENLQAQVQAVKADPAALENLQVVQNNPEIQSIRRELTTLQQQDLQLAPRFGERHPDRVKLRVAMDGVEARLRAALADLTARIQTDFDAAVKQEDSLVRAVETQKRESLVSAGRRAEYEGLARSAATDQEIFTTLLQRAKETGVNSGLVASNIRVVDRASVPQRPVSPNIRRSLLLGAVGGTLLAVLLAFFRDYMDRAIATPEEVKSTLGLPCLGLVPRLSAREKRESPLISDRRQPAAFKEAFRALRTSVLFSSADEPMRTILVTSTGPGEGKSTVTCNLAISLAQTGRRVLIVDADMRKPRVHQILDHRQEPGLAEAIAKGAVAADVAAPTAVPNLWILPSGDIPPNPSDLLSSEAYRQLLASMASAFDWVFIDSPPVLAVTDASLVAHLAAGVIFVVAADQTKGPAASNALAQLDGAGAKFVGAVLNGVNFKRNSFFYGDHYSRKYGDYYAATAAADSKD